MLKYLLLFFMLFSSISTFINLGIIIDKRQIDIKELFMNNSIILNSLMIKIIRQHNMNLLRVKHNLIMERIETLSNISQELNEDNMDMYLNKLLEIESL